MYEKERRRSPRAFIDVVVNCDEKNIGKAGDISETGIRIFASSPYEEGTYVNLSFELIAGELQKVNGKVIWKKEVKPGIFAMGIEFWHPSNHLRNSIKAYVESRLNRE